MTASEAIEPPPVTRRRAAVAAIPPAGGWVATWVEPVEAPGGPDARRPAYHLAGELTVGGPVASATLHATAHGVYEAFLNGTRVGDRELTPGFTAYRARLQVQSFDVTDLVVEGTNALGALLSDGWWRGQHGIVRGLDAYGATTAFLAELHVTLASGEAVVAGTDGSWRSTPSHVLAADLICGEVHDLRRRVPGWASPGTDRSDGAGWAAVRVADHGDATLVPQLGPPVRRIEALPAVSVTELAPRRHVVDFGQNSNGWVRLAELGPAGNEVTLTYGEWLGPDGDVTQANTSTGWFSAERAAPLPFQVDTVTSAGDGSTFEPRHSTKGFQYVRVEGLPALAPDAITSVVVHSDLARLGGFGCSDARIERLHRVADWSFRGNACELPTDCPTRERAGWVGDWQLYVDTAAYLYDVGDWTARWLRDLAADQLPSGAVTNIVPDPNPDARTWKEGHGAAGWGDAAVHVPWEIHRATGRTDVLADQLGSMRRWVDFAAGLAARGRHPDRAERHPDPRPHDAYLWDTGWHFGEWLQPGDDMDDFVDRLLVEDHGAVATAYLHRSASELARIGAVLGDDEVAERYGTLAGHVLDAWRTEFVDAGGRVTPHTQATLVRALAFGLVPDGLRARAADDLVALVRAAGTHLATGFLATPFLLPVLADHGHLDVAYELLFRDDEPSWLHMSDRTSTIWEDWDALRPDGTVSHSLNHYSKGAVIGFLHRYVAGLQVVEPGYRLFRVAPHPGGGITSAATHHDSPYGRITVTWRLDGGQGTLDLTVPVGTSAQVALPDGTTATRTPGQHRLGWASP